MSAKRREARANPDTMGAFVRAALEDGAGLDPARRRVILDAAGKPPRPFWTPILPFEGRWLAAAAAAVLALALVPLAFQGGGTALDPPGTTLLAPASAKQIEVRQQGGTVVLSWEEGQAGRFRVSRGTNPRQLSSTEEVVDGNTWTDPDKNGSQIVFYKVEELEG